ncbi:DsrE family protein [Prolixibacter bellariivorans]|nr:DsrE family protein [Prolixibacter bellariivorans]
MKFVSALVAVLLLMTNATFASGTINNANSDNYALLVSNPKHIKVAVMTAKELFNNPKFSAQHFEVVVCGKAVQALLKNNEQQPEIEKGLRLGISFKACNISLKKAQITPAKLIKGVVVVPNGLVRMFELQKEGYHTIEL